MLGGTIVGMLLLLRMIRGRSDWIRPTLERSIPFLDGAEMNVVGCSNGTALRSSLSLRLFTMSS